ncbi:MAG: class 1 isoprenoid biosynthesis enzyme [Myxococcales bacterium]|nr:class 1 isoprenoid biosynthesis enzyme [Myxococcales bacterium]
MSSEARGSEPSGESEACAQRTSPDETWRALLEQRAIERRALTRVLPYRIGITPRPDGGWGDYVREPIMFDLPAMLADELGTQPFDASKWTRAHHCAGFFGLVADRVADQQVFEDAALRDDRAWLFEQWKSALAEACADEREAERRINDERSLWRTAVEQERSWSRQTVVGAEDYSAVVRGKCAFLWTTSAAMLEHNGVPLARIALVREAFERVMIALQCCDDARDNDEDRELKGASTSELLAVDGATLHATAALVLQRLGSVSPPTALATYAATAAERAMAAVPDGKRFIAALGAMAITQQLENGRVVNGA